MRWMGSWAALCPPIRSRNQSNLVGSYSAGISSVRYPVLIITLTTISPPILISHRYPSRGYKRWHDGTLIKTFMLLIQHEPESPGILPTCRNGVTIGLHWPVTYVA